MSKIVRDAIKFAEKEYNLVYNDKTKILSSKVNVIKKRINITKEFLEDAYAYYNLKPSWIISRHVYWSLADDDFEEVDLHVVVPQRSKKKDYWNENKVIKADVIFYGVKQKRKKILEKYIVPVL